MVMVGILGGVLRRPEALANAAKHARASVAHIDAKADDDRLHAGRSA